MSFLPAKSRLALSALLLFPLLTMTFSSQAASGAAEQLRTLEKEAGGRLGVYAIDTGNGHTVSYRADERFAFCSTFKVMAAAAVLKRSEKEPAFLTQRIRYPQSDLVNYSPITEKHQKAGMTLTELSAAALQYSDNTAANLMVKALGGTEQVTAFARGIGDETFRLDRWETELNTAVPGDERDTTTPAAMARSLEKLALGTALDDASRQQLVDWMKGNTLGAKRIRASVPEGWSIADKTGTGDHGTANDIAVLWPVKGKPYVIAIYYTREEPKAAAQDDVLAAAARIALSGLKVE